MDRRSRRQVVVIGLVTLVLLAVPALALASHSWGNYHWQRSTNPVALTVVDSVNSTWDPYLDTAIADWDQSAVLTLAESAGTAAKGKTCKAIAGKINVCNASYGNTGWLGVAQIWVSGSHITQATTKVNDTYFNTASYNTPAWRQMVMCQEIGHDFGLNHQDENFNNTNLGTCMDYTNDPDGGAGGASNNDPSNEHPNQHDRDQLVAMYSHLDPGGSAAALPRGNGQADPRAPAAWGRAAADDVYVAWLGRGQMIVTFVIWVR